MIIYSSSHRLKQCLAAEFHFSAVEADELDLDLIAELQHVFDLGDAVILEFGDVHEPFLAGEELDKRAEFDD